MSRVITALILLPLAISGILYLPLDYFAMVLAFIFIIGAFEWTKISLIRSVYSFLFIFISLFFMYFLWAFGTIQPTKFLYIIYFSILFWITSFFFIINFPTYKNIWSKQLILKFLVGFFVLIPSWYAIVLIKSIQSIEIFNSQLSGGELLLLMMLVIWIADTGAYFSGKQWGKAKLIPNVSPGKTRQGAYGAIFFSCLFVVIISYVLGHNFILSLVAGFLTIFVVIISIIGDLFESMYKRSSGIKDSGKILPGHGGVLDRIDSLTSVSPIFFLILLLTLEDMQKIFL